MKLINIKSQKITYENQYKRVSSLGNRFLLFRKVIRKTKPQLASEMGVEIEKLAFIENGKENFDMSNLHYLASQYGLNLNWLLSGEGSMFIEQVTDLIDAKVNPGIKQDISLSDLKHILGLPPGEEQEINNEEKQELFGLLQVPAIKNAVLETLDSLMKKLKKDL